LIVGVGDPTDRFSYWPVRIARGGEVLAPPADDPVQFIDARDVGGWTIRCVEDVTEDEARSMPHALSPIIWQLGHLVVSDAGYLRRAGGTVELPAAYGTLFPTGTGGQAMEKLVESGMIESSGRPLISSRAL